MNNEHISVKSRVAYLVVAYPSGVRAPGTPLFKLDQEAAAQEMADKLNARAS